MTAEFDTTQRGREQTVKVIRIVQGYMRQYFCTKINYICLFCCVTFRVHFALRLCILKTKVLIGQISCGNADTA